MRYSDRMSSSIWWGRAPIGLIPWDCSVGSGSSNGCSPYSVRSDVAPLFLFVVVSMLSLGALIGVCFLLRRRSGQWVCTASRQAFPRRVTVMRVRGNGVIRWSTSASDRASTLQ